MRGKDPNALPGFTATLLGAAWFLLLFGLAVLIARAGFPMP